MKNNLQKSNRKNAGFTLLELVVVVAVMGLISSMAMDVYTDSSNQKRFEATKSRLAEIKFAIIGDPMMRVGSQAILTGYYNDMTVLPSDIGELISDPKSKGECDNSGVITIINETSCTSPATWTSYWEGPYLHNLQSNSGNLIFKDAWGSDFNWVPDSPSTGDLTVTSYGLAGIANGPDYEEDKPRIIYATELAYIDNLKSLNTGYCIENSTFKIKPLMGKTTCDAVPTTHKWAAFP
jgi:prepilin-type N-terminal cleavage/methylation domain-containing protein